MLAEEKDSAETVVRLRRLVRFRTPPDQIPYATRSDSVRRPIRFRSPPDQIPYAARSDSVRRPIGFRTPLGEKLWRFREKNHNFNQEKPYFYIEKP